MKIAVVQHRLRETSAEDAVALAEAAIRAAGLGAKVVVLPDVPSFHEHAADELEERLATLSGRVSWLRPHAGAVCAGRVWEPGTVEGLEELGDAAMLSGDAFIDPVVLGELLASRPAVIVASPRSESELQAEAALELALGLSSSVSGLLLISEASGAEPGRAGHGGSAIVLLGEIVEEAIEDDEVLVAEVPVPVPPPEPREPLPEIPRILVQRLANHRGEQAPADYPAELS